MNDSRNLQLRNSSFDAEGYITLTEYLGDELPMDENLFQVNCLLSVLQGPNKGVYWNDGTTQVPNWNNSSIIRVSRVLTQNEIENLFDNPITLSLLPGIGKYIIPDSAFLKLNFGTTPYQANGNLNIVIGSANAFQFGTFLFQSQSAVRTFSPIAVITLAENEPLKIMNTQANPSGGDGTLEVIVYYKIATSTF